MVRYGKIRRTTKLINDSLPRKYISSTYIQEIDLINNVYLTDIDGLYTITLELEYIDPKYDIIGSFHSYHSIISIISKLIKMFYNNIIIISTNILIIYTYIYTYII